MRKKGQSQITLQLLPGVVVQRSVPKAKSWRDVGRGHTVQEAEIFFVYNQVFLCCTATYRIDSQESKSKETKHAWSQSNVATLTTMKICLSFMTIIIIIMKNFNRCNSHGHHGSKRCELAQHAYSNGLHAFNHTLYINTVTTTVTKNVLKVYIKPSKKHRSKVPQTPFTTHTISIHKNENKK